MSTGRNLFIWVAALCQFSQITNPDDIAERWSSYKNTSWLLSWALNEEDKKRLAQELLYDFLVELQTDILSMLDTERSG